MATNFKIHRQTVSQYSVVVYSTSCDSPINHLPELEDELKEIGVKGEVLFDLLLSNGNTSDRFYKAVFNGFEFKQETLTLIKSPPAEIQKASLNFYHSHQNYLACSVLSKPVKFLVKKKALKPISTNKE